MWCQLRLRDEGQSFTILGSGQLTRALLEENLIDRLVLLIFPIVLGTGLRLFTDRMSLKFQLKDSLASATGVILATYVRD
jgi:dihydrofolate reductase